MDANIEKYIELSFQKIRKLKESEKSKVWLALDKSGRLVVLKYIALTGLPYRILKENDFPLCPHIFYVWEDEEKTIVVEEYVNGETLLDRIGRKEYLNEEEAKYILLGLCDGLFPIHKTGVIHRDVKPSNLILQAGNVIRLIDFDASRIVKERGDDDTVHLGTKGYAPPEQFGYGQTDERSDIYSIGVTFQKLLPENYNGYLTEILAKCAAIDPSKRYQNLIELKRSINFHDRFQKWGKKLAVAAVLVFLAIILNVSQNFENSKGEIKSETNEETPFSVETQPDLKEKATILPAESEKTTELAKTPYIEPETIIAPKNEATNTVSHQRNYCPSKINSFEINNIETIEAFLEVIKDDSQAYERWKNDKTYWAPDNATKEEREKASKNELEYMKSVELGSRAQAFMENLPETLTPEERRRAINEYVAEQKKILGIKD